MSACICVDSAVTGLPTLARALAAILFEVGHAARENSLPEAFADGSWDAPAITRVLLVAYSAATTVAFVSRRQPYGFARGPALASPWLAESRSGHGASPPALRRTIDPVRSEPGVEWPR